MACIKRLDLPLCRDGLYRTFDTSHQCVAVNLLTRDREIPGSTPGKYNLQIKITSIPELSVNTQKRAT